MSARGTPSFIWSSPVRALLLDPKIFNYLILSLYVINAARWAYEKKWADVCYWMSAAAITATVTWGYKH